MGADGLTGLLIDADLFLYRATAASEVETNWGDDHWTLHSDAGNARRIFDENLRHITEELKELGAKQDGDPVVLCFSDPSRRCFRHDLSDLYKANRKETRKPLAYRALRDEMLEKRKCVVKPGLEADDVMGIVSTRAPGKYIIVSEDKDMKTIPGMLYRQGKLKNITEAEADYYHLYQTLIGDTTDGYSGCPGTGPKKAEALLGAVPWSPKAWAARAWPAVVETYKKAKLTEKDALLQARFARILRSSDWDFETSKVKLWEPPK
jgi:DNA polymerase-1